MTTDGFDFDHQLETKLRQGLGGLNGPTPRAAEAAYRRGPAARGVPRFGLSLALALAAIGGSAAAAAAATGSTNPSVWGKVVSAAVSNCKADLRNGPHGIGECVSAVAHAKLESDQTPGRPQKDKQDKSASTGRNRDDARPAGRPGEGVPGSASSAPGSRGHLGSAPGHPASAAPAQSEPAADPQPAPTTHPDRGPTIHPTQPRTR